MKIAALAGDGIGPEIMAEALRVLEAVGTQFGHRFEFVEALVGGAAFERFEKHFPSETEEICRSCDAILFGTVGGPIDQAKLPKWNQCERDSILAIRQAFGFFANFRPVQVYPGLVDASPLRREIIGRGVDLLVVRELMGDVYFGKRGTEIRHGKRVAFDTGEYSEDQIRAIAISGFEAARKRRRNVTSVDKANVLDTSKLWRAVVREVHEDYRDVELVDMLVDNCAMQIVRNPSQFDVILTSNLFGDILSDAAAVLPGSLGLLASASFNSAGFGLYEPPSGSAPDIAGQGKANPVGQILSAAMLLRYSFKLDREANLIETAVRTALESGSRTFDIANGGSFLSTKEMTDAILNALGSNL